MSTLPILGGKVYAVWDASFVQSIQLSRDASFHPVARKFMRRHVGYSDRTHEVFLKTSLVEDAHQVIAASMTPNNVHPMNVAALRYLAKELDASTAAAAPLLVDNAWYWVRDLLTMATMEALYGKENPLVKHPSLNEDIW